MNEAMVLHTNMKMTLICKGSISGVNTLVVCANFRTLKIISRQCHSKVLQKCVILLNFSC